MSWFLSNADQTSSCHKCRLCFCVNICVDVSFWERPTHPQVRLGGRLTHWSSVGSSGGGEEEDEGEQLSFCPPASEKMDSSPALLEDVWTCSPLSGGVSSTDCQDEGASIDAGSKGLPWEGRKEVGATMADWEECRRVDGDGDVSEGFLLLEGKTCGTRGH